MSFDKSRFTFDPWNDYCGVVMQQGRVQLDSDWNEWLAELSRRIQAGTLDTLGRAVYPATTPFAFHIQASNSGGTNTISIGPGRMYVDGLLAENHGALSAAQWDPSLAELSGAPAPPPASETDTIDFTQQPYLPNATIPAGNGPFLAYLDVWLRPITYLEDPSLVDSAVGVDTTGRLQTVWQVKLLPVAAGTTCDSNIALPPAAAGRLTTDTVPSAPSGPCCLNPGTGYTGQENQFYRVEIHKEGAAGTATFKWSRDNASVATLVTGIAGMTNSVGNPASQLTVQSMGRDQVLGFAPGNWIEVLDDDLELNGQPGELHQIDSIDFAGKTITLDSAVTAASFPVDGNNQTTPARHTRIRRWDQGGKVFQKDGTTLWVDLDAPGSKGDITVPPAGTTLILENGITVAFDIDASIAGGEFRTGDFWNFAARIDGSLDKLQKAPPRGIHHHYAKLSVVTFSPLSATDCRTKWPPAGGDGEECGCCCTVTVSADGKGKFSSIQAAINSLPAAGGEVCILAGRYFEHVLIQNKQNVVLQGCGWQTRIASPLSQSTQSPPANPLAGGAGGPAGAPTQFNAVISVAASEHVILRSFAVEAADDEVGILLDSTGDLIANTTAPVTVEVAAGTRASFLENGVIDVTIEDTVITASTAPAILGKNVHLLRIDDNRIAMKDVESTFPAVYLSGDEMHVDRNWVGLQTAKSTLEWLPTTVSGDLISSASPSPGVVAIGGTKAKHPGGIQIAGPSIDVYIEENEIEGGSRNGITLGSLQILDKSGKATGQTVGVVVEPANPCAPGGTLQVPTTPPGGGGGSVVAEDQLARIQIFRNRIRNMGLCGIGPVGFFDLVQAFEVISIVELNITGNTITNTLRSPVTAGQTTGILNFFLGYGAICVPDVEGLIIRDNTITDFGDKPGAQVCGIYVLHGQMIEISRNQVLETRDFLAPQQAETSNSFMGGIVVPLVTPPAVGNASNTTLGAFATQIFEVSLPALRVQENVVRVALPFGLIAAGAGTFAIGNNHFSCGGAVQTRGFKLAQPVLIANFGPSLEAGSALRTPTGLNQQAQETNYTLAQAKVPGASSGAVLFNDNICQLDSRGEGAAVTFASVMIITVDHLIFSNNHLWLAGRPGRAITDAMLLAGSLQVIGNRFQETPFAVALSAWTIGLMNITTQNISTHCILAQGTLLLSKGNLAVGQLINPEICAGFVGKQFGE